MRSASISKLKIQKKIVQKFECERVTTSWGWVVKLLKRGSFIGYMYVCSCVHANDYSTVYVAHECVTCEYLPSDTIL